MSRLKYIRAAMVVLAVAICLLIAMPGSFNSQEESQTAFVDQGADKMVAPTPDYQKMEPPVTPTPEPTLVPVVAVATPEPEVEDEEKTVDYILDLWLDASPNMAGISPFDKSFTKAQLGQWAGGFFYRANSDGDESNQKGWITDLLNMLYGKDVAGHGSVRVLRMCAESMLSNEQLQELTELYSVNSNSLIRDTLTYSVLRNNSDNYITLFENLLITAGDMKPGERNPYDIRDCFFRPNNASVNNRTVSNQNKDDQAAWDWQRETTETTALEHAKLLVDNSFHAYHERITANRATSASGNESVVAQDDYLYYALNAMDASHLNVMVVDTLSLPEIDSYSDLYTKCIVEKAKQNNGDLAVGYFVVQLDYAGKISSISGQPLRSGFLWGFENFSYSGEIYKSKTKWRFIQPMPRPLLLLVAGPSELVKNYSTLLSQLLDREMEPGGVFASVKGTIAGKTPEGYEEVPTFRLQGESFGSPEFNFKYRYSVMEAIDVVKEQQALLTMLSEQLDSVEEALYFISNQRLLPVQEYRYVTTDGAQVQEELVPIVETSLSDPLTVALNMNMSEAETSSVAEGQYESKVTVVSAMETSSFTLDELDGMSRTGELDLSKESDIMQDQAYIGANDRVYKFHPVDLDENSLNLQVSSLVIENGELKVTVATKEVPKPGYYWVTLEMSSQALADLDNASWNPIENWMKAETTITFDASTEPSVLSDFGHSWEYTPNNYELKSAVDIDKQLKPDGSSYTIIRQCESRSSRGIHHAWGAQNNSDTDLFPANILPVFRVFQLNRVASYIREGLLDRSGEIDSTPFLTRHFIICVPETLNTGE